MSAAVSASATDLLAKYAENLRWAKSHPDEVGRHRGRYIVVFEGHIVFHSPSKARADAEAKHTPGAYVTYVTPEQWAWILQMGTLELVFDPEKQLFSLPVVVIYQGKELPLEMYVDSGASVSMITIDAALSLGVDVNSLPSKLTGGVSRSKFLRTLEPGGLMIVVGEGKVISPEVRISEPVKDEKTRRKGPLQTTRTMVAPAVNLFGLNSLRACRARLNIDASGGTITGKLEWDQNPDRTPTVNPLAWKAAEMGNTCQDLKAILGV